MANDDYQTISDYATCSRSRERTKLKRHLQLLYETGRPKFIAMDILGPLPPIKNGNVFMIVTTDRNSKMPR